MEIDSMTSITMDQLLEKLENLPREAPSALCRQATTLYCLLTSSEIPPWFKAVVIAALTYLICPIDAVPDFIPGAGYIDDAAVLAMTVARGASMMTPAIKARIMILTPSWCRPS